MVFISLPPLYHCTATGLESANCLLEYIATISFYGKPTPKMICLNYKLHTTGIQIFKIMLKGWHSHPSTTYESGHLAMRSITIPASALCRVLPAKLVTLATCNTMECQLYCDPHLGGDNLCICLLIISNISLKCESSSLFGMIKYQR